MFILLYIAIRFKKIGGVRGAATGIVALLNDMVVIFGIFVVMRIPLNGNFIAAMLVILGYSINDTVVIYDRIRENESLMGTKHFDFAALVNSGVNQSLRRTINTTISTLLALGSVCVISLIFGPVSYTHLDVYKRQVQGLQDRALLPALRHAAVQPRGGAGV